MKLSFENQGTNTYLVCALASGETLDSTCLGMIVNNRIAGLAPALYSQMDDQKFLKYNVSAKISATQLFEGVVNKKRLLGVFRGIVRAVLSAEDYMIAPSMLLLNLDYIFVDVTTAETLVICLPLADERRPAVDFGQYFRDLVFHTRFDQTENCDYVAHLINYLNGTPVFSLAEFSRLLEELDGAAPAASAKPQAAVQRPAAPVQPAPVPVQQPAPAPQPAAPQMQQPAPAQPVPVPPPAPEKKKKAEKKQAAPAQPVPPRPEGEKEISMFTLLMHYSKENKELYKAQQAAKKAAKEAASAQSVPQPGQPAPAGAKAAPASGFAVPGKSQTGFAVPGRPQPGFAVPGQPQPGFAVPGRPQPGFAVPGQPHQGFAAPAQSPAPAPAQPAPVQAAAPVQSRPAQSRPVQPAAPVPQVQPASFGETTVLGGAASGETTVLGVGTPAAPVQPYLLRVKNNERIPINKPSFRIGKERSFVDYFIADNTAISRSHANILNRDGEYYIVDTNSTNHTYVNGVMIRSNVETKLTHGAKITLANESFEFLTY